MRVYELAKLLGVTSKELIKKLESTGKFEGTHMSMLTDVEIDFIESSYKKSKKPSVELDKKSSTTPIKKIFPKKRINIAPKKQIVEPEAPKKVLVEAMTVLDFCQKSGLLVSRVILDYLKSGKLYNVNQLLSKQEVKDALVLYEIEHDDKAEIASGESLSLKSDIGSRRLPVVVVVGHVDHGKTTLLDYIRNTSVAKKEKGGITQHLGAYKVKTGQGDLIFLDTPGHEAFSLMRSRGVKVADLVVLVVAADDGIKPQTIEALNCAQELEVPIVVAITKIDRVDPARIDVVKQQLSQRGLVSEEWGGDVVMVPLSAKTGKGVDTLLEMLALQSEIMDLKANPDSQAIGYVLESHIEKGRGRVATFIAQNGTLRSGDHFICGKTSGRVSVLIDASGNIVKEAHPSEPVKITGLSDLPKAGSVLKVVSQEAFKDFEKQGASLDKPLFTDVDSINIIVKADNDSSREAIVNEVAKKFTESGIRVISSSIGNITFADVDLANSCNSVIYAFGVKFDTGSENLARQHGVDVRTFYVIYHLLDDIQKLAESKKEVAKVRKKVGSLVVKKVFKTKTFTIAGFKVSEGKIVRSGEVEIYRGNEQVGKGLIKSLQRDKKSMKEVLAGFEGACVVEGFDDWQEGDVVDCYLEVNAE